MPACRDGDALLQSELSCRQQILADATSADVLAMFHHQQLSLSLPAGGSSGGDASPGASERLGSGLLQGQPLPIHFALPPLLPSAASSAAAAAMFGLPGGQPAQMFDPAAAFLMNPLAAAAAATYAVAATIAEQQLEGSTAIDAGTAPCPAALLAAATAAPAAAPAAAAAAASDHCLAAGGAPAASNGGGSCKVASALTSHLSDVPSAAPAAGDHDTNGKPTLPPLQLAAAIISPLSLSLPRRYICCCPPPPTHTSPLPCPNCRHSHLPCAPHGRGQAGRAAEPRRRCAAPPRPVRRRCGGAPPAAAQVGVWFWGGKGREGGTSAAAAVLREVLGG